MVDVIVMNVVSLAVAVAWAAALRIRPLSLVPLCIAAMHVLVIQLWVLATGLVGGLEVSTFRWTAAGLAGGLIVLGLTGARGWWGDWRTEVAHWRQRARRTVGVMGWPMAVGMVGVMGGMVVWLGLAGYIVGPYIADVTAYHLAAATDWVTQGRISTLNWPDPRTYWPQGHGLLATWWMVLTGKLNASLWAEWHWVVVTWAVVWALVRGLGGSRRTAGAGVMLTAAVPIVWGQAVSGLNDLAVSVLALGAVAVMVRRGSAARLMLAAVLVVMGLGVKPTMLMMGLPVGLMWLWRLVQGRGQVVRGVRLGQVVTLVAAVMVAGYWYGVNAAEFGNPLYPSGLTLAGQKLLDGVDVIEKHVGKMGLWQLRENLWDLAWEKMWDRHPGRTGQTEHAAGFGLLAASMAIPAAAAIAWTRRRARLVVAVLGAMIVMVAMSVMPDAWNGRFFSFVPVAGICFVAVVTAVIRGRIAMTLWMIVLGSTGLWSVYDGVRLSLPPLGARWMAEHGLVVMPPGLLDFTRCGYVVQSIPKVPGGEPIIVVHSKFYGPVSLFHGQDLSHRLIYHRGIPSPVQVQQWRSDGLRWVLTGIPFAELPEFDARLSALGLKRVEQGLFVIP